MGFVEADDLMDRDSEARAVQIVGGFPTGTIEQHDGVCAVLKNELNSLPHTGVLDTPKHRELIYKLTLARLRRSLLKRRAGIKYFSLNSLIDIIADPKYITYGMKTLTDADVAASKRILGGR